MSSDRSRGFPLVPQTTDHRPQTTDPEHLLVVGASARAACFSALRAGIIPVAGDMFADVDLRLRCRATRIMGYPRGLVDFFHVSPPSPWLYTGALENHPKLVCELAALRTLYGNDHGVLRRVRQPRALAAALGGWNLSVPALRFHAESVPGDGTWMRKAYASSCGSGVRVWYGAKGASDRVSGNFIDQISDEISDRGFYFQQRVEGDAYSAVYVAARGRAVLLGITRQFIGSRWTRADGFRYAGSVGPLPVEGKIVDQFRRIGEAVSQEFGLLGLFGVDAVVEGETVWTIEVNPRYTASVEILERALGIRSFAMHLDACCEGHLPEEPDWRGADCCGKAIIYARRDVKVSESFLAFAKRFIEGSDWPSMADIPAAGTMIRRRSPVATVFAVGDEFRAVRYRLQQQIVETERHLGLSLTRLARAGGPCY